MAQPGQIIGGDTKQIAGVLAGSRYCARPCSEAAADGDWHRGRADLGLASEAGADEPASYVGGQICSGCHATQAELWKQSHHALAMQEATDATVLGDFSGVRFEHSGIVTTFSRSGNKFLVQTDGPDGVLHEYEIAHIFGVYPLQQYLIALPGGRLQAFGIAWDSRPKEQGGQRWLHLYPNQNLQAGGPVALDRAGPDLELSVRRLPFDRPQKDY